MKLLTIKNNIPSSSKPPPPPQNCEKKRFFLKVSLGFVEIIQKLTNTSQELSQTKICLISY